MKTKNSRIMLLSKRAVCNSKKSNFLKEQEARRRSDKLKYLLSPLTEPCFYDVKEEIKVKSIYETIFSYCLKCRKNTGSKNLNVVKSKIGRIMLLSKCAVSNSKKSKLFKEQEDKG